MYYTIYKITNNLNGKFYIGMHKTENLNDNYMGSGKLIQLAIKKHGVENFTKEILHVFYNEEEMKSKEKELVVLSEQSYNLCAGGHGGFGYINSNEELVAKRDTKENKRKGYLANLENMRKSKSQLKNFSENVSLGLKRYYAKNSSSWVGKKHKPETIEKMKAAASGRNKAETNPNFGKCWITNGEQNVMIYKKDIDIWGKKGYRKGRIMARGSAW